MRSSRDCTGLSVSRKVREGTRSSAEEDGQAAARVGRKGSWPRSSPRATPDHHRRLGARHAVAAPRITRSLRSGRPVESCLTRAAHRPVVWPHEIPDSGISHRNAGAGPRSGTEAGDISPVFTVLEHAAGDLTTLGKNPLHGGSSPPSDTKTGAISPKPRTA